MLLLGACYGSPELTRPAAAASTSLGKMASLRSTAGMAAIKHTACVMTMVRKVPGMRVSPVELVALQRRLLQLADMPGRSSTKRAHASSGTVDCAANVTL